MILGSEQGVAGCGGEPVGGGAYGCAGLLFSLKGGSVGGEATTNGVTGGPNIFLLTTVADYL